MDIKINLLDYGKVTHSEIKCTGNGLITMDVQLSLIFEDEKEVEIVTEAILQNINK